MADSIRMDSHKLIYHPEAVARWLRGENIYPIEIEISPSGACNHRCSFCAVDYLRYKPVFLKKDIVMRDISFLSKRGLKSIICSGEGEPLLNPDMPDMANSIKGCDVDVAMSTNGVLFTEAVATECLSAFTWIRFSIASFETESYNAIQRGAENDLEKVKENLQNAVRIKKTDGLNTTLGVQCLLMEDNAGQLPMMAKELKSIGVDYLTVKPYSRHLHSVNDKPIDYGYIKDIERELREYNSKEFAVYCRLNAAKSVSSHKCYNKCLGLPFMTHIDSSGNVWPCIAHIGTDDYLYGNIYDQNFEEIWNSQRRIDAENRINTGTLNAICRQGCRLDSINRYLWELKNPGEHVNFI